MTDIALQDMSESVGAILEGRHTMEERALIEVEIFRGRQALLRTVALNEAVVTKGSQARLIEFELNIDGEYVYQLRADGVIVATPTGSTAYALSAQGPILQPTVPAFALVPLNPHVLSARPVSVSDASIIEIRLLRALDARAHFDGFALTDLQEGDRLVLKRSADAIHFVHPPGYSYFSDAAREAALEQNGRQAGRGLMLRALGIRDLVIVERVELETGAGFTVLTGETGAGKSILVDAIELLVGGRADASLVREGAERAELSAEFDFSSNESLKRFISEAGLEGDPDSVILRRTIDRAGRSRCFVNGHSATLAQLREAGEHLVDIHGQHEHQSLLRAAAQRELLDAHAGAQELAGGCADAWRAWKRLEALAAEAEEQFVKRETERAELQEKVAELKKLGLKDDEWDAPGRATPAPRARLQPAGRRAVLAGGALGSGRRLPAAARRRRQPPARAVGARRRISRRSSRCSSPPRRRRARRRATCATTPRAWTWIRRRCARRSCASRRCMRRGASTA